MDIKDTKEITAEMAVHLKRNIVNKEPLDVDYQIACYDMVLALANGNPYVDRYVCRDAAFHLANHADFFSAVDCEHLAGIGTLPSNPTILPDR